MPTSSRAGSDKNHARLDGEILRFHPITLPHSTHQGGSVGSRDDVGIVPYMHDGLHSTQYTLANRPLSWLPYALWQRMAQRVWPPVLQVKRVRSHSPESRPSTSLGPTVSMEATV